MTTAEEERRTVGTALQDVPRIVKGEESESGVAKGHSFKRDKKGFEMDKPVFPMDKPAYPKDKHSFPMDKPVFPKDKIS